MLQFFCVFLFSFGISFIGHCNYKNHGKRFLGVDNIIQFTSNLNLQGCLRYVCSGKTTFT